MDAALPEAASPAPDDRVEAQRRAHSAFCHYRSKMLEQLCLLIEAGAALPDILMEIEGTTNLMRVSLSLRRP